MAVAIGAVVGIRYAVNDEPEYIQSAEIRVGSYLTSDYGLVACGSKKVNDLRWELDCTHQEGGKTFQWICPYISRHLLSLNPLLACCRRYSRGER